MKNMLKDTSILFVITLVAGLFLGVVYEITKDPIAQQQEKARQEAFRAVFEEASDFEEIELTQTDADTVLENAGISGVTMNEAVKAIGSDGSLLGYCVTVTSHEGYGGDIKLTVGIKKDGTLNGISFLTIAETPGLGMKAGEVLAPQFVDKNADHFEYTKTGATLDNQIDAISGATITTEAVTDAVNASLEIFRTMLVGGDGNE